MLSADEADEGYFRVRLEQVLRQKHAEVIQEIGTDRPTNGLLTDEQTGSWGSFTSNN